MRWGVIGAGIAGLSAARALAAAGVDVTVFDRGRRPGGRASSRLRPGTSFDYGAQYLTVSTPTFGAVVDTLERSGDVAAWSSRLVRIARDGTVAPSRQRQRWVGCPDMGAVARHLAAGLDLRLGTAVDALSRHAAGWRLAAPDGDASFDGIVLAMPPEQACRLLPPGHRFGTALERVKSVCCWAGLLELPAATSLPYEGAFVEHDAIAWIARDSSKPGRPPGERWVVHATAEWSKERYVADPATVADALRDAFRAVTAVKSTAGWTCAAHRWGLARVETPLAGADAALYDAATRLAVCGDWCIESRVEGAFESGAACARAILEDAGNDC